MYACSKILTKTVIIIGSLIGFLCYFILQTFRPIEPIVLTRINSRNTG